MNKENWEYKKAKGEKMQNRNLSDPLKKIHDDICEAIKRKRVITFSYDGRKYEIAPHYLFEEDGIEQLQGFDSQEDVRLQRTKKDYQLVKIASLQILDQGFIPHLNYRPLRKYKTIVHCYVDQPKKYGDQ